MSNLKRFLFVPILLGLFLFLTYIIYQEVRNKATAQFNSKQIQIAKSAAQGISDYIYNYQNELKFLSNFPNLINYNSDGKELLKLFFKNHGDQLEAISRVDPNGVIIDTYPEDINAIGRDISNQEHVSELIQLKKPVISDVFNAVQGYLAIAIHVPVFDSNEFKGSIAILIAIDKIGHRYLKNMVPGENGYAFLLSKNNIELYCPYPKHIGKSIIDLSQNEPTVLKLIEAIRNKHAGSLLVSYDEARLNVPDEKHFNFYRIPLGNTYWTILISNPKTEVSKTITGFQNRLILLFSVLLIILLIYFYFFTKARVIIKSESKRKKAEKALIESEAYMRALFDQSPIGLALTTMDGKLVDVNQAFANIIGYSIEETLELSYWDITPKAYEGQELKQLELLNTRGSYGPYEKEYIHKDGHLIPVRLQGLIVEKNGQPHIWSSVEDITEHIISNAKLVSSENKFKALVEQSLTGIYIIDKERFLYVNNRFCEIFGYSEKEVINQLQPTDVIDSSDRNRANDNVDKRLRGKVKSVRYRAKGNHKDKRPLWIEIHGTQIELEGKNVITGTVIDITQQKKIEEALRNSEIHFRQLFQANPQPMWVYDLNTLQFLAVNEMAVNKYGYSEEEFLSMTLKDIRPQEEVEALIENIANSTDQIQESGVWQHKYKDGTLIYVEIYSHQLSFGNKEARLVLANNITERKLAEDEVKNLNKDLEQRVIERTTELTKTQTALLNMVEDLNTKSEELEKSKIKLENKNKELETFTYSVSHDLKAPLRGIDGYSQILLKEYAKQLDTEGQRFLKNIRQSALQMNQLINDLLEYSRLERRTLNPSSVKLKELTERMISHTTSNPSLKKTEIILNIPDKEIFTDKDGLSLILRNLLENAIKFTKNAEKPSIEIGYQHDDKNHTIFVRDNGIGFDMKFHDRIFQIFQRLQRIEDYEGTGVGLAMVSKAIERLNGKVWAKSKLGIGTTFYVKLPKLATNENNEH